MFNRLARWYRMSRALGAAAMMFIAIGFMLWARSGKPTYEHVSGTITRVVSANNVINDQQRIARIRLDDGREAGVIVPLFAANLGQAVPVLIEAHDDGDTYVSFDWSTWLDQEEQR